MANFNPIEIEKCIKGVQFPADKQDIINKARENRAREDVMRMLEQLPDQEYRRPTEITEELAGSL
jgi:hypothetical protein